MANIQISGLTAVASLTSGDVFALDQSVGNLSKKITTANLATAIVTTTNVTSAGALMDSELTSIADVKALNQSLVIGAAPVLDATNFTNLPSGSVSIGDAIGGAAINQLLTTDGSGNLSEIPNIINTGGAGSLFLADDGVYKAAGGGVSIGDTIGGGPFANSVLWVNSGFALQSNNNFSFDGVSLNWTGVGGPASSSSFGILASSGNAFINNTSIGNSANQNSMGSDKTSVGWAAGQNSSGGNQVAIGVSAGKNSLGNDLVSIGAGANTGNVNGNYGIAIGSGALQSNTGQDNISIGWFSSQNNTGIETTALGRQSLAANTGSNVIALGKQAGFFNNQSNRLIISQNTLPKFNGSLAANAVLPPESFAGVYLYWDTSDNTIKARV